MFNLRNIFIVLNLKFMNDLKCADVLQPFSV